MNFKTMIILSTFVSVLFSCTSAEKERWNHPCEAVSKFECHSLGVSLSKLDKTKEALDVFKFNCERNNAGPSCVNAGVESYKEAEIREAIRFYEIGCSLGEGLGCSNRACFLDPTSGCEKVGLTDIKLAQDYYVKGCELREAVSCYNYGLLMRKIGDEDISSKAFAVGCSLGDIDSCNESKGKKASDGFEILKTESQKSKKTRR